MENEECQLGSNKKSVEFVDRGGYKRRDSVVGHR